MRISRLSLCIRNFKPHTRLSLGGGGWGGGGGGGAAQENRSLTGHNFSFENDRWMADLL